MIGALLIAGGFATLVVMAVCALQVHVEAKQLRHWLNAVTRQFQEAIKTMQRMFGEVLMPAFRRAGTALRELVRALEGADR